MPAEDWDVAQLERKCPGWKITRDEGDWFTARRGDEVFRNQSAAAVEFALRCHHDEAQVAAVAPKPWQDGSHTSTH